MFDFIVLIKRNRVSLLNYCCQLVIFFAAILLTHWLIGIEKTPIDLDEVAWVNDAQVYEWRITNQWKNFEWSKNNQNLSWTSPDFRLFDQPHLIKYIYGAVLSKLNIKPWLSVKHQNNYLLFTQQSLSGKLVLDNLTSNKVFGKETIQAIKVCRMVNIFFSLLFFYFYFYFFLIYIRYFYLLSLYCG